MGKQPDSFSYHEALDRTHILLCHLENALGDHPVIQSDVKAIALYQEAVNSLSNLYQLLGAEN